MGKKANGKIKLLHLSICKGKVSNWGGCFGRLCFFFLGEMDWWWAGQGMGFVVKGGNFE